MNKKLKTIIEDIFKMESTDLNAVVDAIKMRRNQLHTTDAHSLRIGERVSFQGRHGSILKGVVEKIKIKLFFWIAVLILLGAVGPIWIFA